MGVAQKVKGVVVVIEILKVTQRHSLEKKLLLMALGSRQCLWFQNELYIYKLRVFRLL